ncbi:hypothetical protein [Natronosalvus vescus]|uniref:hypothetical protein n=1 Tax=Natronosalvus vescus TaxID=2953881 RepID=UPI0020910C54|nr:hypothetical protein [Natronosalvus vescus]
MPENTHDIGNTRWFRAITGTLWALVVALTAVGLYTVAPEQIAMLYTSEYVISTALFGTFMLGVAFFVFRHYPIRTPSGRRDRRVHSR